MSMSALDNVVCMGQLKAENWRNTRATLQVEESTIAERCALVTSPIADVQALTMH